MKIERHLSRLVVEDRCGKVSRHAISILSIQITDGVINGYEIEAYERETEAVTYHDRPLLIATTADGSITMNEVL